MKRFIQIAGLLLAGLIIVVTFQNCQEFESPDAQGPIDTKFFGTSTGNPPNPSDQGKLTFDIVSATVFEPYCVSCHGADRSIEGIRYDTYEHALRSGLMELRRDYIRHREPSSKCTSISNEGMDLVVQWINEGAN